MAENVVLIKGLFQDTVYDFAASTDLNVSFMHSDPEAK